MDNKPVDARLIAAAWRNYQLKVLPPLAPDIQVLECRRAFYAGAVALLDVSIDKIGAGTETAGLAIIDGLHAEIAQYVLDMKSGKV